MLLLGLGASAQTATLTLDNSWFEKQIEIKDNQIEYLRGKLKDKNNYISVARKENILLTQDIDSLMWYKRYYIRSKNILSPRIIKKIEDEGSEQ